MALPLPFAFWPFTVTAGVNDKLDFSVDATQYTGTVPAGTYYSIGDLMAAVQAALLAPWSGPAGSIVVALSTSMPGHVGITVSGAHTLALRFATGANRLTAIHRALGFTDQDASFSSATKTGASQHVNGWYALDPVIGDTGDLAAYQRASAASLRGGRVKGLLFGRSYSRKVTLGFLPAWKAYKVGEGASHLNEAVERLLEQGWARFRWWPDQTDQTTCADYAIDTAALKALPYNRLAPAMPIFSFDLPMLRLGAEPQDAAVSALTALPNAPVITYPTAGISVPGSTRVVGTADPLTLIHLFVDGTEVGTTMSDVSGKWALVVTLSLATHVLTACGSNLAGSGALSASVSFTQTTAGIPTLDAQPDASLANGPTPSPLVLTGTTSPGARVNLYRGGVWTGLVTNADATGRFTFSLVGTAGQTNPAPEGSQSYTVTAASPLAPAQESAQSAALVIFIDYALPVVYPFSIAGPVLAGAPVQFTVTASRGVASLQLLNGSTPVSATVTGFDNGQVTTFTVSFTAPASAGSYNFGVVVTDTAGLASATVQTSLTVVSATTATPTLATVPSYWDPTTTPLSGTAVAGSTVRIYMDGTANGYSLDVYTTIADGSGNWSRSMADWFAAHNANIYISISATAQTSGLAESAPTATQRPQVAGGG